jgi:trigger factor
VTAEKESIIGSICKDSSIHGFRKGKAPRGVILSKFSDAIEKRLHSSIIDKSFNLLNEKQKSFTITSVVDVKREEVEDGMVCTLVVDIIPEFELPDYGSISVDPIDVVVDDSEVENGIKNILRQHAKYVHVDRTAEPGDFVKLSYGGKFSDGARVEDNKAIPAIYGTQTNTWEEAGSTSAPGVRSIIDGIVGAKAGDTMTVSQTFDEVFEVPELAGQTISYEFEVGEVRECVLPELTDDILKTMEVKSKDELRARVRSSIANIKTSQARFRQREELTSKLLDMVDIKVPDTSVDIEAELLTTDFINSRMRHGNNLAGIGNHVQEIFGSFRPLAATRVKLGALLDKIAANEKIEVESADIENMVWQDVYAKGLDVDKYVGELKRDSIKLSDIRSRALRGKTLDLLISSLTKGGTGTTAE